MILMIKKYSELKRFETFDDRFDYLSLQGHVGAVTFGFDRWVNQRFYTSREWRQKRNFVIARDAGRDLGAEGHEIHTQLLIHHMNPITPHDIQEFNPDILDPEFLITTTHKTHNALHYGDRSLLPKPHTPRQPGDTLLW